MTATKQESHDRRIAGAQALQDVLTVLRTQAVDKHLWQETNTKAEARLQTALHRLHSSVLVHLTGVIANAKAQIPEKPGTVNLTF